MIRPHRGPNSRRRREPVPRKDSGPAHPGKPFFQFATFSTGGELLNSAPNLGDRQSGNKQIVVGMITKPIDDGWRHGSLGCFAYDIRVEQIAGHKSRSRNSTTSRSRFRSAPTSGELRIHSINPPRRGGLVSSDPLNSLRRRAAAASFLASRLASPRSTPCRVAVREPRIERDRVRRAAVDDWPGRVFAMLSYGIWHI